MMATMHHNETSFAKASSIMLPVNRFYFDSEIEEFIKTRQDYSPYRSAQTQQQDSTVKQAFIFIGKTKNFSLNHHPARYYSQPRTQMNEKSNTQQYSRYRDATYHEYHQSTVSEDQNAAIVSYSKLTEKHRHQNEYSRYRSSESTRPKSTSHSTNGLMKTHSKSLTLKYDSEAQRFPVPEDRIKWSVPYPEYVPVEYTTKKILSNPKADSPDPSQVKRFNQLDGKIDRRSFTGHYYVDPKTKRPRNPVGRTGMTGRGRLYHWGPNHAGDPVVTRWKRDSKGSIVYQRREGEDYSKPVLQFVAIQRGDTKQWALPGGMVDPGEGISETVKREFQEEAGRSSIDENLIRRLFANGFKLYQSYVDDPRNTDNAWMETIAMHFHDETGELTKDLNLNAGDDADKVMWCTVDHSLDLYANHKEFLQAAVQRLEAFW